MHDPEQAPGRSPERLAGKRIVVTGAGSGIGRAAALRAAAEGASVLAVDLEAPSIDGIAGVACDVSDPAACEAMAAAARERLGGCDGVYANAGIAGVGTALTTAVETWDRVLAVNLTGVWLTSRALLPLMLEAGAGSIVHQASTGGLVGVPGIAPYAAAKGGVIGLTRQMAVDFGPQNIRVNALCPGTVPTPLVAATYRERAGIGARAGDTYDDMLAAAAKRYPLGRLGTVDEIAAAAVWLLSDESSWVSGQAFAVDGGYTAA